MALTDYKFCSAHIYTCSELTIKVAIWWKNYLTVYSYHVTYAFQSESTLCSCLNVKELVARNRCKIWSLNDRNWTRTHNCLVRKHLAKLGSSGCGSESSCSHLKNYLLIVKWLMPFLMVQWLITISIYIKFIYNNITVFCIKN